MPKIYFTKHGFTFRDKRINAFSPIHQIHRRELVEITSVYEDLPIILRNKSLLGLYKGNNAPRVAVGLTERVSEKAQNYFIDTDRYPKDISTIVPE